MNEATPVIEIAQNTLGRDFVVGDIHGCFSTVEHALAALDCDLSRDRLFSVGDLIDHGARSDEALAWTPVRYCISRRRNTALPTRLRLGPTRHVPDEGGGLVSRERGHLARMDDRGRSAVAVAR